MHPQLLVDYELSIARQGFIVRALLRLEGRVPAGDRGTPLDLAIVLDRSGSMGGEKLERAKEAASFLARRLRPTDLVGVVAYDDGVTTVAEPARGADAGALARAIDAIAAGNSTNLSGGWLRGHELVAGARGDAGEGALHRVLLLTDGLANEGITDPERLVGLCRAAAAKGISTSTIGFGTDYDEALLRAMADAGGGNSWYIERPDQAPGVFEEEIEGLLTLSAQNVTVDVAQRDAVQLVAVHNDYPSSAGARGIHVELGDLYAREPKSLLLEFFVPGIDEREVVRIADVVVTAYALTDGGGVERQEVRVPVMSKLAPEGMANPEVRREMLLLDAARAREEALRRRDAGDVGGAREVLLESARALAALGPECPAALAEQAADLSALADKLAAGEFDAADAKYAAQRAYNARRGKGRYEEKLARKKER